MAKKPLSSKPIKKQTLAEQMASTIQALILSGELGSGEVLPTEPELAEQFGVSRAVVRDATRILMAQGLVEVRQGAGVFVTPPQNEAFGEALLLALRRVGATVWDVEQFEQIVLPEVMALAATAATAAEVAEIRRLTDVYLAEFAEHQTRWGDQEDTPVLELERLRAAYQAVMQAVFAATHNQVLQQLARPLLKLRNFRNWRGDEPASPETAVNIETTFWQKLVDTLAARDPDQARAITARLMCLPPEAVEAMRQTPVGEIPLIPLAQNYQR
jgi:GntR family transcriptional repressor for pyruvate dehydrogenase complex